MEEHTVGETENPQNPKNPFPSVGYWVESTEKQFNVSVVGFGWIQDVISID